MGFNVSWTDHTQNTILSCAEDDWTWPEFITQVETAYSMIGMVDHMVDVIVDGLGGVRIPPGDMVVQLRSLRMNRPTNMGRLLLIGANPFIRAMGYFMGRVYPQRASMLQYVDSIEAAYHLIETDRLFRR